MTSTPSATAWSIAATESPVLAPQPPAPLSQQTLYAETRARGAMPLTLPKTDAAPVVGGGGGGSRGATPPVGGGAPPPGGGGGVVSLPPPQDPGVAGRGPLAPP